MKSVFPIIVLIISIIFISSCNNDDNSEAISGTMKYMVDGTLHNAVDPYAVVTSSSIKITGTTINKQSVILYLHSSNVGDYILHEDDGNYAEYFPNSSNTNIYSSLYQNGGSGRVRIKNMNYETMSGEFNFTAYKQNSSSSKTITQGTFSNVPYTYIEQNHYFKYFYKNKLYEIESANGILDKTNEELIITAENDSGSDWYTIKLRIPESLLTTGSYIISGEGPAYASMTVGFNEYQSRVGKIVITNHDFINKKIEGSFYFSFTNGNSETEQISAGQFAIMYQVMK